LVVYVARVGIDIHRAGDFETPADATRFRQIVALNESRDVPDVDPADLEAGANRCAVR
jgi:hypothetical protein